MRTLALVLLVASAVAAAPLGRPEAILHIGNAVGGGTAVLISPTRLLTARHVGRLEPPLRVAADAVHRLTMSCEDDATDIAVLTASAPFRPEPYQLASDWPRIGDPVTVAGYSNGYWTVSHGSIDAISSVRIVGIVDSGRSMVLALDPTLYPGASGSPVLDAQGRVIGIITGFEAMEHINVAALLMEMSRCRRFLTD